MTQDKELRAARTVRCQNCGGSITVTTVTPRLSCPFCHQSQELDAQLLQELSDYQAQASARVEGAGRELEAAREWSAAAGRQGASSEKKYGLFFALVLAPPLLVFFVFRGLAASGVWSGALSNALPFAMVGTTGAGILAYFLWAFTGKRAIGSTSSSDSSNVKCPNCGAVNAFEMGQVVETCSYCQGALFPTAPVIEDGLTAAHQAERAAQIERYRLERSALGQFTTSNKWGILAVIGFLLLVFGGSTIVVTFQFLGAGRGLELELLGSWFLTLMLLGAFVGVILRQRARKRRILSLSTSLATQIQGEVSGGDTAEIDWLDTYWAGPYESSALSASDLSAVVTTTVSQYPVAVFIDLMRSSHHRPPKLEILLSAWLPGISDGKGQAPRHTSETLELQATLHNDQFVVDETPAGLRAHLVEEAAEEFPQRPEAYLSRVPGALVVLVRLASALGAPPGTASWPNASPRR